MIILKTKNYKKSAKFLPEDIEKLLLKQEKLLENDIFHPGLHTKKLHGLGNFVYSFRITGAYRGIFRLSHDAIILFAIGHRKDIYQF